MQHFGERKQEEADVAARHLGGPSASDHQDSGLGRADGGRSTADTTSIMASVFVSLLVAGLAVSIGVPIFLA